MGRHLPLAGMRTCRLVCKRWSAVIGESVAALGASADLLRSTVLDLDAAGDHIESSDDEGHVGSSSLSAEQVAGSMGADTGVAPSRLSAATQSAMGQLRRLSRQLARAFPRAHTCCLHIDIG